jgi:hypothetical protein
MPGLDPGIHQASQERFYEGRWIAGSGPAMTNCFGRLLFEIGLFEI